MTPKPENKGQDLTPKSQNRGQNKGQDLTPYKTINNNKDYKENNILRILQKKNFSPPTVEAVKAYCEAQNSQVDPQMFVDHYDAVGWMVGSAPMTDWQSMIRVWERNAKRRQEHRQPAEAVREPRGKIINAPNRFHNFEQRDTDYNALVHQRLMQKLGRA